MGRSFVLPENTARLKKHEKYEVSPKLEEKGVDFFMIDLCRCFHAVPVVLSQIKELCKKTVRFI